MTLRKWFYRKIYLHSPYWHWLRRKIGERAHWACEVDLCMRYGHNLDVHHTVYHLFLEWLFPSQLIYLCRKHHNATHAGVDLKIRGGKTLKAFKYGK